LKLIFLKEHKIEVLSLILDISLNPTVPAPSCPAQGTGRFSQRA